MSFASDLTSTVNYLPDSINKGGNFSLVNFKFPIVSSGGFVYYLIFKW
jgi:hypothetical protein